LRPSELCALTVPDASPRRLAQAGGRNPEKLADALALVDMLLYAQKGGISKGPCSLGLSRRFLSNIAKDAKSTHKIEG
jgi:hypothetical protein